MSEDTHCQCGLDDEEVEEGIESEESKWDKKVHDDSEEKEFKELEEANESLRSQLEDFLFINETDEIGTKRFWEIVNSLINNEIDQEGFCNQ